MVGRLGIGKADKNVIRQLQSTVNEFYLKNGILMYGHRTPFFQVGRILGPHGFKDILLEIMCLLNNLLWKQVEGEGLNY